MGTLYCQVIVDIAHENVARPFTYRIPAGLALQKGQRVAVPFGYREKEGVVLSFTEDTDYDPEKIKEVLRPLEDYPAILPALIELAQEMAVQAHCPLAETLRLMMPAEMRGGRVKVRTVEVAELAASPEEAEIMISSDRRSRKRREILELLVAQSPRLVSEIAEQVPDPRAMLKDLAQRGMIRLQQRESLRTPGAGIQIDNAQWHSLTPAQQEVLEEILPTLSAGGGRFLLHGVTGSGKTEVFLTAVRRALEQGKSAIILVPEIALTPQMVSWFRGRFGPVAAVLHSRLSAGERFDEWRRIRRGEARVVIGARSAVFAPTENLGLIVVDEEHESTYFSDHHPRYDARQVAESRCAREGASLILASATPSILSFAKARRGDYMLLEMPRRVADRPLPEVAVVDMRQELENGNRSVLSRELVRQLADCLARGEQAMLLINRRGYHSFVSCRSCGYVVKCPQCDVSMTYHVEENGRQEQRPKLRCHYCGNATDLPQKCPSCGSPYIRYFGAGTQKVEAEVQRLFPGTATARMDIDTTGGKDGHARILEEFRSGRARVLVGTQMIAKGLDFPQVTLVGVVAADLTLNLPDYRSRERTFQLLTQVAGRAGRGTRPGRVVIQTYRPEDQVIALAARQDYRAFFEEEFQRRKISLYPPFTVMARVLIESAAEAEAEEVAKAMEEEILTALQAHPEWKKRTLMMSLEPPGIKYLRGLSRRQILFKLLTGEETERFCGFLTEMADRPRERVQACFEYNPTNMI
ncbi:MAG: primosomal protein N' [Clostridia bacterium]|nr:primosomal protein N' [Clostridia bacterium]